MAYNGHPLRGFLQRQLVIAWPHTVEHALAEAWRDAGEGG
jgi:hypothetical protein